MPTSIHIKLSKIANTVYPSLSSYVGRVTTLQRYQVMRLMKYSMTMRANEIYLCFDPNKKISQLSTHIVRVANVQFKIVCNRSVYHFTQQLDSRACVRISFSFDYAVAPSPILQAIGAKTNI